MGISWDEWWVAEMERWVVVIDSVQMKENQWENYSAEMKMVLKSE